MGPRWVIIWVLYGATHMGPMWVLQQGFIRDPSGHIHMGPIRAPYRIYHINRPSHVQVLVLVFGGGEKSSPQETKGSISFSANITDMRIPSQIICNCYTKVFDIIHIFGNCTF